MLRGGPGTPCTVVQPGEWNVPRCAEHRTTGSPAPTLHDRARSARSTGADAPTKSPAFTFFVPGFRPEPIGEPTFLLACRDVARRANPAVS